MSEELPGGLGLTPYYHVGIVVPDIHEARARLTRLLGVHWGPFSKTDSLAVRDGDGVDRLLPNLACYTTEPPHLELIQEQPGTVWVCNEFSNLHHIGFFGSGLAAVSNGLTTTGCPLELWGRRGDDAPAVFAYHRDPLGVRIEVVDAAMRGVLEQTLFQPAD